MTDASPAPVYTAGAALLAIRILSVAPLALAGALYLLHPAFRESLDRGIEALFQQDRPGLREWAESCGVWAPLGTTILMVVQALVAPIPAILVTITNSLLFGWVLGGILSILSATLAAVICYGLARGFGEPLVARLVPATVLARNDAFMARHGAATILVSRLLPFVPFDPIGYLAGLCRVPLWTFTWATIVGQIPAGMTYSYLAQRLDQPASLALTACCAFAGLVIIGVTVRRILLPKKSAAGNVALQEEGGGE